MTSLGDLNTTRPVKPVDAKPLPQYADYTHALAVHTPATGFKEFSPRDSATQAKYDAMQDSWQGIESSDKAIAAGVYALDYASDDRGSKPNKPLILPPPAPPKKADSWFCVVQ
jgi:hypothetical protein